MLSIVSSRLAKFSHVNKYSLLGMLNIVSSRREIGTNTKAQVFARYVKYCK